MVIEVGTGTMKAGRQSPVHRTGARQWPSVGKNRSRMNNLHRAFAPVTLLFALSSTQATAAASLDPLRFFVGSTETVGTLSVVMHKTVKTRSIGRGQLKPDGTLYLLQRVEDEGKAPYLRQWNIHQIGAGRFSGTMSEATSPVAIDQVGNRYRFRFKMKGDMSVEQWLTPLPGGQSASSDTTVRKFGFAVATSAAIISKLP